MGLNEVYERTTGRAVAKFYQDVHFQDGSVLRLGANTQEELESKAKIIKGWIKTFGEGTAKTLLKSLWKDIDDKIIEARQIKSEERKKGIALEEVVESGKSELMRAGVCMNCHAYLTEEDLSRPFAIQSCPYCRSTNIEKYEVELDPIDRRFKADVEKVAADRLIIRKVEQDAVKDKLKKMGRRMRGHE